MTEIDAMSFNVQRLTKRCHKLLAHINQQAGVPYTLVVFHLSVHRSQEAKKAVGTSTWGWFIGGPATGVLALALVDLCVAVSVRSLTTRALFNATAATEAEKEQLGKDLLVTRQDLVVKIQENEQVHMEMFALKEEQKERLTAMQVGSFVLSA